MIMFLEKVTLSLIPMYCSIIKVLFLISLTLLDYKEHNNKYIRISIISIAILTIRRINIMASPGVILKPMVLAQHHSSSASAEGQPGHGHPQHGRRNHRAKFTKRSRTSPLTPTSCPKSVQAPVVVSTGNSSEPSENCAATTLTTFPDGGERLFGFEDMDIPDNHAMLGSFTFGFIASSTSSPVNGVLSLAAAATPGDICSLSWCWNLSPNCVKTCSQETTSNNSNGRQVHFAEDASLVNIVEFDDDVESQDMRECYWEIFARDRARFKDRIQQAEEILNPILDTVHRAKILFKNSLNEIPSCDSSSCVVDDVIHSDNLSDSIGS